MKLKLGLLFTILTLAAPIIAAPAAQATVGQSCSIGPGGVLSRAHTTYWATAHNFGAKNPCDRWYVISWGPRHNAGSDWSTVYVAPGHKFNTSWKINGHGIGIRANIVDGEPNFCSADNMNYVVGLDGKNTVVEYSNC